MEKLNRLKEEKEGLLITEKYVLDKLNNNTVENILKESREKANNLDIDTYKKHLMCASLTLPIIAIISVIIFIFTQHIIPLIIAAGLISYYEVALFPPGLKFFRTIYFSCKNLLAKKAKDKDLNETLNIVETLINNVDKQINEQTQKQESNTYYISPVIKQKTYPKTRKLTLR